MPCSAPKAHPASDAASRPLLAVTTPPGRSHVGALAGLGFIIVLGLLHDLGPRRSPPSFASSLVDELVQGVEGEVTEVEALVDGELDFPEARTTHEANNTDADADAGVVSLCYDAFELGAPSGAKRPKGFQGCLKLVAPGAMAAMAALCRDDEAVQQGCRSTCARATGLPCSGKNGDAGGMQPLAPESFEHIAMLLAGPADASDLSSSSNTFEEVDNFDRSTSSKVDQLIEKEVDDFDLASSSKALAAATTTASGLKIEVLTAGSAGGTKPTAADRVRVDYEGKLASDGSVFDSSYARGKPVDFALGGVIAGWTEALQLMSVGEKARLTIPAALGYGAEGMPDIIPGGATLIFDVELHAINP